MHWQAICDNPIFNDLPFKCETDRWGHVVMSPATNKHSWLQGEILYRLRQHCQEGYAFPECSIQTSQGVKVADVVWGSQDFFQRNHLDNPYQQAPEIVVEILSPSNSIAEMTEKQQLYFACGAKEFWLCDEKGILQFHKPHECLLRSEWVIDFPVKLQLPFSL